MILDSGFASTACACPAATAAAAAAVERLQLVVQYADKSISYFFVFLMQAVLAGEKLAPALLDVSNSRKAAAAEEGGEVATAPALEDH